MIKISFEEEYKKNKNFQFEYVREIMAQLRKFEKSNNIHSSYFRNTSFSIDVEFENKKYETLFLLTYNLPFRITHD